MTIAEILEAEGIDKSKAKDLRDLKELRLGSLKNDDILILTTESGHRWVMRAINCKIINGEPIVDVRVIEPERLLNYSGLFDTVATTFRVLIGFSAKLILTSPNYKSKAVDPGGDYSVKKIPVQNIKRIQYLTL